MPYQPSQYRNPQQPQRKTELAMVTRLLHRSGTAATCIECTSQEALQLPQCR
jgi:hypothetical protein